MAAAQHTIKVVAKMTGLSPHVIRVWEKRYGAVSPNRTKTNRRLYSDAEVERLSLLRHATELGHSIGTVARLGTEQLRKRVSKTRDTVCAVDSRRRGQTNAEDPAQKCLREALEAVRQLDTHRLEERLREAKLAFGARGLLGRVVAPLTCAIGDLWHRGEITAAHEHFASAMIRVFLGAQIRSYARSETAPGLIVATPAGQLHELGAVIAAAAAASQGWRVTYLGPSLPAAEIAGAALQNQARAVALSIVYPEDDPALGAELEKLRRYLPAEVKLLVGGRAAPAYQAVLQKIGASHNVNLAGLYAVLDEIRMLRPAGVADARAAEVVPPKAT